MDDGNLKNLRCPQHIQYPFDSGCMFLHPPPARRDTAPTLDNSTPTHVSRSNHWYPMVAGYLIGISSSPNLREINGNQLLGGLINGRHEDGP